MFATRLIVLLAITAGACSSGDSSGRVFFISPADGATVSSPVAVEMGVADFIVEPAANGVNAGCGHLHIMVDTPCVQERLTVPPDEQHLHFGQGQTSASLELPPGEHFLCLQAADGKHTALRATHEITITVE
jgi:hypothetical protein